MNLEDSQRSERSVTSSLFPELSSLAGDRLEQFTELDMEEDSSSIEFLYDSHDESEDSSSESEDDRSGPVDIEESLLPTEVRSTI